LLGNIGTIELKIVMRHATLWRFKRKVRIREKTDAIPWRNDTLLVPVAVGVAFENQTLGLSRFTKANQNGRYAELVVNVRLAYAILPPR
jgi:hypothetical protein